MPESFSNPNAPAPPPEPAGPDRLFVQVRIPCDADPAAVEPLLRQQLNVARNLPMPYLATLEGEGQGSEADLGRGFTYHPPKPGQTERYESLRSRALGLAVFIRAISPPSREQSVALTKLEEAIFWANAAIARGE